MAEKLFMSSQELRGLGLSEPMIVTFRKLAEFADTLIRLGLAEGSLVDLVARQIISGAGLTGGGDLSADRTLAVGAGTGITVNADDVAIDTSAEAERVRDTMGTALVAGTGITVTPNDGADTITIAATGGYTDEQARDAIGAALVAGTNITITVNDGADTITIDAAGGGAGGVSLGLLLPLAIGMTSQ